jgi:hypothetical protein
MLIDILPAGKLRGCALLNRAHCFVALGQNNEALSDIDSIIADRAAPGIEALSWPKVWMSRGHIHRKLAEAAVDGVSAGLYACARQDFERALAIGGSHAHKAERCVEQLHELERRTCAGRVVHIVEDLDVEQCGRDKLATSMSDELPAKRQRLHGYGNRLDSNFAQIALQALGSDCIVAGRSLLKQGEAVITDAEAPLDGGRRFQIRTLAGVETVTLQPQELCLGQHIGECTCWMHGHCKHVAAALLVLLKESSKNDISPPKH